MHIKAETVITDASQICGFVKKENIDLENIDTETDRHLINTKNKTTILVDLAKIGEKTKKHGYTIAVEMCSEWVYHISKLFGIAYCYTPKVMAPVLFELDTGDYFIFAPSMITEGDAVK